MPKTEVVLYSKSNCSLCDKMKAEMARAGCDDLYTLRAVDIESDPELFARYRYDIPVLCINGVEAFKHRLTAADFRERLQSSITTQS